MRKRFSVNYRALKHYLNGGCYDCLYYKKGETPQEHMIAEIIHFLYYHRWWDTFHIGKAVKECGVEVIPYRYLEDRVMMCHPNRTYTQKLTLRN